MITITRKMVLLRMSMIFVLGMLFIACEGPTGPQGPQGLQGELGPIGPAGEDGSVMYAGEGAPAEDQGKLGDFYLDTDAAEMYGPKTQEGWGVPFSLKGPPGNDGEDGQDGADGQDGEDGQDGADGQDGKDGSQIYAGTTAPAASLGKVGDYYLNTATFDLYGPKTASGWGTPINLQATTNVMYSVWFNIVWNGSPSRPHTRIMEIPESRITHEFLNSGGIVLMYLKEEVSGDLVVFPLPLLFGGNDYFYFASISAVPPTREFNGIFLTQSSVDGTTPLAVDFTGPQYGVRYVLIPGSEQIGSEAAELSLPVDLQNYQQVQKYFGIKN